MKKASKTLASTFIEHKKGELPALRDIADLVYREMHALAKRRLAGRAGQTFSPTALVNETFLRLMEKEGIPINDRNHLLCICARTMRWILLDYSKEKRQQKRGGGQIRVTLDENQVAAPQSTYDLADLGEALDDLEKMDERLCQVVELRFLVGLSVEETAEALGISATTVKRDWDLARAWLHDHMS